MWLPRVAVIPNALGDNCCSTTLSMEPCSYIPLRGGYVFCGVYVFDVCREENMYSDSC